MIRHGKEKAYASDVILKSSLGKRRLNPYIIVWKIKDRRAKIKIVRYNAMIKKGIAAMNLIESFNRFWYRKESEPYNLKIHNDKRMKENFEKQIKDCNGDIAQLDEAILSSRDGKETLRRIAVAFYNYLEQEENTKIESNLFNMRLYNYPFERQIEIAKYLHEPHTNEEIISKFSINERTLRQDLEALRNGIEVLGTTIQIEESKKGRRKSYKCTMHPVFLPLNLTEVYALTTYMPRVLSSSKKDSKVIDSIVRRIEDQLSDYAIDIIKGSEYRENHEREPIRYVNDEDLANSRDCVLMYLMKSRAKCKCLIGNECIIGNVYFDPETNEYKFYASDGRTIDLNEKEGEFYIIEYQ